MFEDFYQSIYPSILYQWITMKQSQYKKDHIRVETTHHDPLSIKMIFQGEKVIGQMTIWSNQIVEEEINDLNGHQLFYLHYTLNQLSIACNLFDDFYQTLLTKEHSHMINIGLCCSGGLSSSLFAKEIQAVCDLQGDYIHINSLSLEDLEESYKDYDLIYLAPQIAYEQSRLMKKYHQTFSIIDPTDYASKNYRKILETIQKDINELL